jgi:GMP synthase (glutamine-hydrolysing)
VLAIDSLDHERATALTNRITGMNRVVAAVETRAPLGQMRVRACALSADRVALLRRADAIVRRISHKTGYDHKVWQFPVILIPLGTERAPESVVLRPVHSVDGMTAQSVAMEPDLLGRLCSELMELPQVAGVFYDLTHKPPGTIEWE